MVGDMSIKTSDVAAGNPYCNGTRVYSAKQLETGPFLTHAYDTDTGAPLCKRVRAEHLLCDPCSTDEDAAPTCPVCLKRDPRFNGKTVAS